MKPLSKDFFARDTLIVAREMIGHLLVHKLDEQTLVGRIVETEAYKANDPACHAYGQHKRLQSGLGIVESSRAALLFKRPGLAYVYLNYGVHWLFNVVTEAEGTAGAVLVRALEPLDGIATMQRRRIKAKRLEDLTNGPGKLTQALGIGEAHNGLCLQSGTLFLAASQSGKKPSIATSGRIGISKAQDYPWRFYDPGSLFVS